MAHLVSIFRHSSRMGFSESPSARRNQDGYRAATHEPITYYRRTNLFDFPSLPDS